MTGKILVTDDEPDMRSTLSLLLQSEGFEVATASDGLSAVRNVEVGGIDLVLLDIRMPNMDGIETLAKIKTISQDLPVIMITGYGNVEAAVQAVKRGAFDYVSKPFDNEKLIEVVKKALNV